MRKQLGYSSFPAILLTFSLLLLVLAVGFVVGRVVVARAYLDRAPKLDSQVSAVPEAEGAPEGARSSAPGRTYVPPPTPPAAPGGNEASSEGRGLPADASETSAGGPDTPSMASPPERNPEPVAPSPRSETPSVEPRPQPAPAPPHQAEPPASDSTYSIQVGVFTSLQGARQVIDELARSGYPARIAPERRGSQELYRVVTGRYRSEYAARKALDQLRKEGFEAFLVQE